MAMKKADLAVGQEVQWKMPLGRSYYNTVYTYPAVVLSTDLGWNTTNHTPPHDGSCRRLPNLY
jgi:hypothetical protein